jgi:hypothetical protein
VLVQDVFTLYFETPLLVSLIQLAHHSGYRVFLAPYSANGKPLHVQGVLGTSPKAAIRNGIRSRRSTPVECRWLVYRQECQRVSGLNDCPKVLLPQEWHLRCVA